MLRARKSTAATSRVASAQTKSAVVMKKTSVGCEEEGSRPPKEVSGYISASDAG